MTYILGARCDDGVVMIADRRITIEGGRAYQYADKLISDLKNVTIGFSGSTGKFNRFRTKVRNYIDDYVKLDKDHYEPPIGKLIDEISDICYF